MSDTSALRVNYVVSELIKMRLGQNLQLTLGFLKGEKGLVAPTNSFFSSLPLASPCCLPTGPR